MKNKIFTQFVLLLVCFFLIGSNFATEIDNENLTGKFESDDVDTFKDLLKSLSENANNELFVLHFQSMIDVIEAKGVLTSADIGFISATIPVFSDQLADGSAANISSYLDRKRTLTIAWTSPTDGAVSFFRLKLPKDWDKDKTYPLYVDLHGLTSIANNPIEYLTNYYRVDPSTTFAFEDGYQLSPWARGNFWYEGISETDVWEGIDVIEKLVKIDPSRKYLVGHSMGGYGTWSIASTSADVWAAIGIQAGALWYDPNMLSDDRIRNLSNMPTYIVVGTNDGLYDVNLAAYNLLVGAGNQNVEFVTFVGGHEKLPVNVENMYLWIKEFVNEDYSSNDKLNLKAGNSLSINPNPVLSETTFHINLEKPCKVRLNVYDCAGRELVVILNKELDAGESNITWSRGKLKSGIYFYSLEIGGNKMNGKLILY
jgi:hypothetical protein